MSEVTHHFHYPIGVSPKSGRLRREYNYDEYIKQLIEQVLLTSPGERINRPEFGAGLRRMIFSPNDPTTASMTQTLVYQSLKRWLGHLIQIDEVNTNVDVSKLEVEVVYTVLAHGERRFLNLEVTK